MCFLFNGERLCLIYSDMDMKCLVYIFLFCVCPKKSTCANSMLSSYSSDRPMNKEVCTFTYGLITLKSFQARVDSCNLDSNLIYSCGHIPIYDISHVHINGMPVGSAECVHCTSLQSDHPIISINFVSQKSGRCHLPDRVPSLPCSSTRVICIPDRHQF